MPIKHLSELLVGVQVLLLHARKTVFQETARPTFTLVAPELTKGLLEQVGRVQALVGRQQRLE